MKKLLHHLLITAGLALATSAVVAQTGVVQSVENVSNKVQSYTATHYASIPNPNSDMFTISGSATKTVYIKTVRLSCVKATGGYQSVWLRKNSVASAHVSATAATVVPHDSANAEGTASVLAFSTAAPTTLGTGVSLANVWVPFSASGTMSDSRTADYLWGTKSDQYIVLRGVAQQLAVSFGGASIASGVCSFTVSWMEK